MSEPHQEGDGATPGPSWCGARSSEIPDAPSWSPLPEHPSRPQNLVRPELVSQQRFPSRLPQDAGPVAATRTARTDDEVQLQDEPQPVTEPRPVTEPHPVTEHRPDDRRTSRRTAEKGVALLSAAVLLLGAAVAVGWSSASAGQLTEVAAAEPVVESPALPEQAPVPEPPPPVPAPVTAPDPAAARPAEPEVMTDRAPSPPRRLSIPRLKIDTPLINLGLLKDGQLEVPAAFDIAGWHSNGVAPGDIGPAVIVGHVDSFNGPGIFYRVRELKVGEKITVDRADGSQVVFEVYGKEIVPKDKFPTDKVYGDTEGPELRLLTCGGSFNDKTKSYRDNILVFARQVVTPVPS